MKWSSQMLILGSLLIAINTFIASDNDELLIEMISKYEEIQKKDEGPD